MSAAGLFHPIPGVRALVITPMVRRPSGSTWRASLMASLAARSLLPGVTARMRQLSRRM